MPVATINFDAYGEVGHAYYPLRPTWEEVNNNTGTPSADQTYVLTVGAQQSLSGWYNSNQAFCSLDISNDVPQDATILDIKLYFTIGGPAFWQVDVSDFIIELRQFDWGGGVVDIGDYQSKTEAGNLPLLAYVDTNLGYPGSPVAFTSYPALIENINRTGTTRFMLCSSKFVSGVAPVYPNDEYVTLWGPSVANPDYAYAEVTYERTGFMGYNF